MSAAVLLVCAAAFGQPAPILPSLDPAAGQDAGAVEIPGVVVSQPLKIIYQQPPAQPASPSSTPATPPLPQAQTLPLQAGVKTPSPETPPPEERATAAAEAAAEQPSKLPPWYSIHYQGTFVYQGNFPFHDPYHGPNSAIGRRLNDQTATGTLYFDARPWQNGEIIFDPEFSGGTGLDGTTGFAGFPNGEATRTGKLEPTPYVARLFYRHTFEFEGESEKVEDAANEIAGVRQRNRLQISLGKMSAEDVIDDNLYSHDPRTQFLNWSIMYTGAWDYPANLRGYSYGALFDYSTMFYAVRYGIFAEPTVAQGNELDPHFLKAHGQILEFQENFVLQDHPARVREWLYVNTAHMGKYRDALAEMPVDPDVTVTRAYRNKYGFGLSFEKELTDNLGFFLRGGWNDGQSETWAFTEIDSTAAAGFLLKGKPWGRPADLVGLAGVINGLSNAHKDYLAAGGIGFIIGDGKLNYAPEEIAESFYSMQVIKNIYLTLDMQGVNNPAYNHDRGPVLIMGFRAHAEF
jgi:high affinity Mn2+ porin